MRLCVCAHIALYFLLQIARGFVGRLMADPAFAQKLAMESLFTVGTSLAWEYSQRGDRFLRELDLATINTVSLVAATGAHPICFAYK